MRRHTAMTVIMIVGILLAVCGAGYAATQFVEGGAPDGLKLGMGIAMTVIGIVVLVTANRRRRMTR